MVAEAFVQFRVTPEVKAVLRALADREQITESALIRRLLEVSLLSAPRDDVPRVERPQGQRRDERLTIRMSPEDRMLLAERSRARCMRSATYVSVLIRSHLRNLTPLPKEEMTALKRSIAELGALGRNLNQIARALNVGSRATVPGREDLVSMLKIAEGLRDHVKALLRANAASWKAGHDQTRH
jgi:predicted DNA-binding protein